MEYLKNNYTKDFESRQANVEELVTFANRSGENSGGSEDERYSTLLSWLKLDIHL